MQKPERQILDYLHECQADMVTYLRRLVLAESPSTQPESHAEIMAILEESLVDLGFSVEMIPGRQTGGQLITRSTGGSPGGRQLLIGHCDTVWPCGTTRSRPFEVLDSKIKGPGVYDMKGGLTQIVFALRALSVLDLSPLLEPVVLVNSDEEIGSFESETHIRRLAQEVKRVFVLEPALGNAGKLKTARKGIGQFSITIKGKAAHAGLDPEEGISAIRELSDLIPQIYSLEDPSTGLTVNVGVIEGGVRPNVVAPSCQAIVDVRVPTLEEARRVETALRELSPRTPGAEIQISGGIIRPPLEKTPQNERLWSLAKTLGESIGLNLEQGTAGGASDGNTTSQYAATLDGLGPVGGGAHADHEFILLDSLVERCALLALLILAP